MDTPLDVCHCCSFQVPRLQSHVYIHRNFISKALLASHFLHDLAACGVSSSPYQAVSYALPEDTHFFIIIILMSSIKSNATYLSRGTSPEFPEHDLTKLYLIDIPRIVPPKWKPFTRTVCPISPLPLSSFEVLIEYQKINQ